MATLNLDLYESANYSVLGPDWIMRLNQWSKIPKGELLLDAVIEDGNTLTPVQARCRLDSDNTMSFLGIVQ